MWFENHVPGYRFRCGGASQFAASVDTNLGPNSAEPTLSQVLPASAASFQSLLIPIEHSAKSNRSARERQSERDDNARRAKAIEANGGEAPLVVPINANTDASDSSSGMTSKFDTGEKFDILMTCAASGVDALRNAIIDLAKAGEVDDVLVSLLQSNALNAEEAGDDGRAKFLRKVAEVCVRERSAAGFD